MNIDTVVPDLGRRGNIVGRLYKKCFHRVIMLLFLILLLNFMGLLWC